MAQQTIAAETITNLIYEKVNKKGMIFGSKKRTKNKTGNLEQEKRPKCNSNQVETRMKLLEENSNREFNGNIDTLI